MPDRPPHLPDIDAGWLLGFRTRLVTARDEGWHLELRADVDGIDGNDLFTERIASWNGQGWVQIRASKLSTLTYRKLHRAGVVRYRGLRSVFDRPVWEPVTPTDRHDAT